MEKRSLEEKLKELKEKKTSQKGNVAFSSRKGNMKIVSKKEDELNPKLTNKQQDEQAKRCVSGWTQCHKCEDYCRGS